MYFSIVLEIFNFVFRTLHTFSLFYASWRVAKGFSDSEAPAYNFSELHNRSGSG